jgi:hypothetical protein
MAVRLRQRFRPSAAFALVCLLGAGCKDKPPDETPSAAPLAPEPKPPAPSPSAAPPPPRRSAEPNPESTPSPSPPAAPAIRTAQKPAAPRPAEPAVTAVAALDPPPSAEPKLALVASPEPAQPTSVRGSSASGEGYSVSIQAPSPVRPGETASAQIVLNAKSPYKCNDKYPYKFVLDPPSGSLRYPQTTVRGMAIGEKQSTMGVPFSAQSGPATISGLLHFSVCTADKCLIEKQKLSVTVQVK